MPITILLFRLITLTEQKILLCIDHISLFLFFEVFLFIRAQYGRRKFGEVTAKSMTVLLSAKSTI